MTLQELRRRAAQSLAAIIPPATDVSQDNAGRGVNLLLTGSYTWGVLSSHDDPEAIDDPTERLKVLAARDGTHDREAKDKARSIFFRDMVWRPYVRAGMPYGDSEEDAKRWAEEQKAARVDDDVDMSWYTGPKEPDLTYAGIPQVGLMAIPSGRMAVGLAQSGFMIQQMLAEAKAIQRDLSLTAQQALSPFTVFVGPARVVKDGHVTVRINDADANP